MSSRRRPEPHATPPLPVDPLRRVERQRLASAFKALAETKRLEILHLLASQRAPVCVRDIVRRIGLRQPTVSHHLRVLRQAGLVAASKQGIWVFYAAEPAATVLLAAAQAATHPPARARRRGTARRAR